MYASNLFLDLWLAMVTVARTSRFQETVW